MKLIDFGTALIIIFTLYILFGTFATTPQQTSPCITYPMELFISKQIIPTFLSMMLIGLLLASGLALCVVPVVVIGKLNGIHDYGISGKAPVDQDNFSFAAP